MDLFRLMTPCLSHGHIGVMYDHTVLNSIVQLEKDNENVMREEERQVGGLGPFNDKWLLLRTLGGIMSHHTVQNNIVQERGTWEHYEGGRERGGWICTSLMTPWSQ